MNERLKRICYTLKHKFAFLYTEFKLCKKITKSGMLHDNDKLYMYCFCWDLSLKEIAQKHRESNPHHVKNSLVKSRGNLIETIVDWECARLTKSDKPLNAYETLMMFYPDYVDIYLPIIEELLPHQLPQKPSLE